MSDDSNPTDDGSAGLVRLEVNLNMETAAAIKEIAAREDISITEAIRRSISIHKFVVDEIRSGRKIHTMEQNGKRVREMKLL